ncbi:MAG: HAD family hydrolase [Sulfobacillus sp.]
MQLPFESKILLANANKDCAQSLPFVVLDLDHTLFDCSCMDESTCGRRPDGTLEFGRYIYRRPFLTEFLSQLFSRSRGVSVWTAAEEDYMEAAIGLIFTEEQRHRLRHLRSRKHCVYVHWQADPLKPLRDLWAIDAEMDGGNTVAVDDTPRTAALNPANLIGVARWEIFDDPKCEDADLLAVLSRIAEWRPSVRENSDDVLLDIGAIFVDERCS